MPNLRQIYSLKRQYTKLQGEEIDVLEYLNKQDARNEIKKAFDSEPLTGVKKETRVFAILNESLSPDKPDLLKYFDEGQSQSVALLFIDITSFSKHIFGWSNADIRHYLDEYYNKVIPVIYKHGGVIEKVMGDGIICLFGKPFLVVDSPQYVYHAEDCAKEVITMFYDTDYNVKVAIHEGEIAYYKVPGDYYGEYTMIGQPITDLYRLESVSEPNAINFFKRSPYDKLGWEYSRFDDKTVDCGLIDIVLQGIDYQKVQYMKFPGFY